MRKVPGWVWFAAVPAVVIIAVSFAGERVFPDSGRIEKIGRDTIAEQTGHGVTSMSCEKVLHITHDMKLPCHVVLDDGTMYASTATVHAHYHYAHHYGLSARFSSPPGAAPAAPARQPSSVPQPTPWSGQPSVDANDLSACVQAAGNDVAKLEACTR